MTDETMDLLYGVANVARWCVGIALVIALFYFYPRVMLATLRILAAMGN